MFIKQAMKFTPLKTLVSLQGEIKSNPEGTQRPRGGLSHVLCPQIWRNETRSYEKAVNVLFTWGGSQVCGQQPPLHVIYPMQSNILTGVLKLFLVFKIKSLNLE